MLAEDLRAIFEAGVDDDALAGVDALAGSVRAEDEGLRNGRLAAADPEVDVVQRGRPQADEDFARCGRRIRSILVTQNVRPAALLNPDRLHAGTIFPDMTTAELERLAAQVGID